VLASVARNRYIVLAEWFQNSTSNPSADLRAGVPSRRWQELGVGAVSGVMNSNHPALKHRTGDRHQQACHNAYPNRPPALAKQTATFGQPRILRIM